MRSPADSRMAQMISCSWSRHILRTASSVMPSRCATASTSSPSSNTRSVGPLLFAGFKGFQMSGRVQIGTHQTCMMAYIILVAEASQHTLQMECFASYRERERCLLRRIPLSCNVWIVPRISERDMRIYLARRRSLLLVLDWQSQQGFLVSHQCGLLYRRGFPSRWCLRLSRLRECAHPDCGQGCRRLVGWVGGAALQRFYPFESIVSSSLANDPLH